jgi:ankyrin repeat protein
LQALLARPLSKRSRRVFHFLRRQGATADGPIERFGFSELTLAVMKGDLTFVQELLDIGVKVNSLPAETLGRTPLQAAAGLSSESLDIVHLLLEKGADVNAPTACINGITALGAAAEQGQFNVALLLLKAGADINAEFSSWDWQPITALQEAAHRGRLDMVHLLLKAGADLHLPKHERYVRAAETARKQGHVAIATILEHWRVDGVLESSMGCTVFGTKGDSLVWS